VTPAPGGAIPADIGSPATSQTKSTVWAFRPANVLSEGLAATNGKQYSIFVRVPGYVVVRLTKMPGELANKPGVRAIVLMLRVSS
jgi:hypothetical protein